MSNICSISVAKALYKAAFLSQKLGQQAIILAGKKIDTFLI